MKIDSIVLIGMAAAMFALPSCKKDKNETSTKEYLKGSLTFTVPSYVTKGEVFDLTPMVSRIPTLVPPRMSVSIGPTHGVRTRTRPRRRMTRKGMDPTSSQPRQRWVRSL